MDIINAYPELENELVNYVPAFEKLKNPLLRHTVAKVATLQQAATIGRVFTLEFLCRIDCQNTDEYG